MLSTEERRKSLYSWIEKILEAHGFWFGDLGRWYLQGSEFSEKVCLQICYPVNDIPSVEVYLCANDSQNYSDSTFLKIFLDTAPKDYRTSLLNDLIDMTKALSRFELKREKYLDECSEKLNQRLKD